MKNCPFIPMGAITGRPTRERLRAMLANYLRVGIDQFMIYPRSGLELEYMGEEWLEVCRHIIEFAAEKGMAIWLYDEYNWPSGRCAGQVIKANPKFAAKRLDVFVDGNFAGKARAFKLNHDFYFQVTSIPLYGDLLSPEAVDCFIELTHEKYFKRFGKYFGSTIKGFFTDEPAANYAAQNHSLSGSLLGLPYYEGLEEDYKKLKGRDFRADLAAHFSGEAPASLWGDYWMLLGRRFRASYLDKTCAWCASHGVLSSGHLMDEDTPFNAIKANGEPLRAINAFGLPGMDEIWTSTSLDKVVWLTFKMLENASAAKGLGALIEVFALGPSDMTPAKLRQMLWLAGLHGADHYVLAVSALDAKGNVDKPCYYNPLCPTQPWFDAFRELGDDARKAAAFATEKANFKIAVRYPQTVTVATELAKGAQPGKCRIVELLRSLVQAQWQVLLVDEDAEASSFDALAFLTASGIGEERSGKVFEDEAGLLRWLESHLEREAQVFGPDGLPARDMLVKTFANGTTCVLSLSQVFKSSLSLRRPGKADLKFDLPAEGVFVSSEKPVEFAASRAFLVSGSKRKFKLSALNSKCAAFNADGVFEFVLREPLKNLRVALREYGGKAELSLDGRPLKAVVACESLPEGLKGLYGESETFALSKGRHVLRSAAGEHDIPYLPTALLLGSFGVFGNELGALPERVSLKGFRTQGLPEYTGRLRFELETPPEGSEFLQIDGDGLASELFVDGKSLGRRLWAPFAWRLPAKRRELAVELSTSVGPLFGDYTLRLKDGQWVKDWWPKVVR